MSRAASRPLQAQPELFTVSSSTEDFLHLCRDMVGPPQTAALPNFLGDTSFHSLAIVRISSSVGSLGRIHRFYEYKTITSQGEQDFLKEIKQCHLALLSLECYCISFFLFLVKLLLYENRELDGKRYR